MRAAAWLVIGAMLTCGGCALFGYDFDRYQPATSSSVEASGGAGGAEAVTAGAPAAATFGGQTSAGGAADAAEPTTVPIASTLGAGGAPLSEPSDGAAGVGGAAGTDDDCGLWACVAQEAVCGAVVDACGEVQLCGSCFWWFEECRANTCVIPD